MSVDTIIQIFLTAFLAIMGYAYKRHDHRIEKVEELLQDTREKYVHKEEIKELKQSIEKRFDRLENILLTNTTKES